jgi:hypothetical protein
MSSKHLKPGASKKNPRGNEHDRGDSMQDITGSVRVTGEIETHVPSSIIKERKAAEEKKDSRDKNRFTVECVTAVLLAIYAGITLLMYCANR